MRAALVLMIVGCTGTSGDAGGDAPGPPACAYITVEQISCAGGTAIGRSSYTSNVGSAHCGGTTQLWSATCAQGCALEGTVEVDEGSGMPPDRLPVRDPAVLCAERPAMKVGDPCTDWCVPTRAELAPDGTVSGQTYLACDPTSKTCVGTSPPQLPGYLAPCPSYVLGWVTPPATGYVILTTDPDACLLAWDAQASQYVTAMSADCIGDWQCPAGTLCDDQLVDLASTGEHHGVCKPGPRGVLTPAMLTK